MNKYEQIGSINSRIEELLGKIKYLEYNKNS